MPRKKETPIGVYAYWAGLALSVIVGFFANPSFALIASILAIIVGAINVTRKESQLFLLWIIGAGIVGVAGLTTMLQQIPQFGDIIGNIVLNIFAFFSTAAVVFLILIGHRILKSNK